MGDGMRGTQAFYKRSVSSVSDKGALLKVSQLLNERFLAAWTKDGLRDYLQPISSNEGHLVTDDNQGSPVCISIKFT